MAQRVLVCTHVGCDCKGYNINKSASNIFNECECKHSNKMHKNQNKKENDKNTVAEGQICLVTMCENQKKRVLLKHNPSKNHYEYTLKHLQQKVISKYKTKGLDSKTFRLETMDGKIINNDQDIIDILLNYPRTNHINVILKTLVAPKKPPQLQQTATDNTNTIIDPAKKAWDLFEFAQQYNSAGNIQRSISFSKRALQQKEIPEIRIFYDMIRQNKVGNKQNIDNIARPYKRKNPINVINKKKENSNKNNKIDKIQNVNINKNKNNNNENKVEMNENHKLSRAGRSQSFNASSNNNQEELVNSLILTQNGLISEKNALQTEVNQLKQKLHLLGNSQSYILKYEQDIKQLKEENEMLKIQLLANQPKEDMIPRPKGEFYECDEVFIYKSKDLKDIKMRNNVIDQQQSSHQILNIHSKRLKEWTNFSSNLENEFLKHNKQKINKNDKEGDDNDDEKQEDELNISVLLESFTSCFKLLRGQKERTERLITYFKSLNIEIQSLNDLLEPYKVDVSASEKKYIDYSKKYIDYSKQRIKNQKKVQDLIAAINEYIEEENKMNNKKCAEFNTFNLRTIEQNNYKNILQLSQDLRKKYAQFGKNVERQTNELEKYFKNEWDNVESKWKEWNINDIICWLKYLIHQNKLRLVKADLNNVTKLLEERQITGDKLDKMDKSDLRSVGFTIFDDTEETFQQIRFLVETYPRNRFDSFVLDPNDKNKEKLISIVQIPEDYKCPITGEIMQDPVIIYDNKTYERNAIIKYLNENKIAPNYDQKWEGDEPMIANKALKRKINLFLKVQKQFTPK